MFRVNCSHRGPCLACVDGYRAIGAGAEDRPLSLTVLRRTMAALLRAACEVSPEDVTRNLSTHSKMSLGVLVVASNAAFAACAPTHPEPSGGDGGPARVTKHDA